MGKFITVTFLMLGWAFYELSGGADFVPERREVVMAEAAAEESAPQVTRSASTATLISLNMPARTTAKPEPEVVSEVVAGITPAVANAAADLDVQEASAEEVIVETVAESPEVEEAPVDLRVVDASRVNMRQGPGTDFNVIDAYDRGTEMEVLMVDPSGWAQIRVVETGEVGWMAERLLTEG